MRLEKREIWDRERGEYRQDKTFGFVPFLVPYIHEDEIKRPALLVMPGGAYRFCSPTEGEPVAMKFFERGYQVFVLTYTTNMLGFSPVKKQTLNDIARAVRYIRVNSEEFRVLDEKVIVLGFSAGGHATASVCVHYDKAAEDNEIYKAVSARPDLSVLCYPVITSDPGFTHQESINMLLGDNPSEEELLFASNEKNIKPGTPPAFLWHTVDDDMVPVKNSLVYAENMMKHGNEVAVHLFTSGIHGLSTADGNSQTTTDNSYTEVPLFLLKEALLTGKIGRDELKDYDKVVEELNSQLGKIDTDEAVVNREALEWVDLADTWIKEHI